MLGCCRLAGCPTLAVIVSEVLAPAARVPTLKVSTPSPLFVTGVIEAETKVSAALRTFDRLTPVAATLLLFVTLIVHVTFSFSVTGAGEPVTDTLRSVVTAVSESLAMKASLAHRHVWTGFKVWKSEACGAGDVGVALAIGRDAVGRGVVVRAPQQRTVNEPRRVRHRRVDGGDPRRFEPLRSQERLNEFFTGKLAENVDPAATTTPWESSVTALAESLSEPPR